MKKKMLCFVMIAILLSGLFSLQAFAEEGFSKYSADNDYIFDYDPSDPYAQFADYGAEICSYHLESFETYDLYDEYLIIDSPQILCAERVGKYVFKAGMMYIPYSMRLWIHDKNGNQYKLSDAYNLGFITDEDMDKIADLWSFQTVLAGDIEADDKLTIADATALQRALAFNNANFDDIHEYYNYYQRYNYLHYDFNDDGEININDVTCIQKELAHIDWR